MIKFIFMITMSIISLSMSPTTLSASVWQQVQQEMGKEVVGKIETVTEKKRDFSPRRLWEAQHVFFYLEAQYIDRINNIIVSYLATTQPGVTYQPCASPAFHLLSQFPSKSADDYFDGSAVLASVYEENDDWYIKLNSTWLKNLLPQILIPDSKLVSWQYLVDNWKKENEIIENVYFLHRAPRIMIGKTIRPRSSRLLDNM